MIINNLRRRRFLSLTAGLGSFLAFPALRPVLAGTKRDSHSLPAISSHSSLRLLAAPAEKTGSGQYRAAVALQLKSGFKTYWRHPGDSGVPPVFDFTGSENLASAIVSFPAPLAFADGAGGHSYGYTGPEVLFPVAVTAVDPQKPVLLRLKAEYAVCEKICIPANGSVSLTLDQGLDAGNVKAIQRAQASVPHKLGLTQGESVKVLGIRKSPVPEQFIVEIAVPAEVTPAIFLEGETPWFFEPKGFTRTSPLGGEILVAVIERSKAADCTGVDLVLTLVADKIAIEVSTRLDLALVTH